MIIYCFKCRKRKEIENPERIIKGKRRTIMLKGVCPDCNTPVYKIIGIEGKGKNKIGEEKNDGQEV